MSKQEKTSYVRLGAANAKSNAYAEIKILDRRNMFGRLEVLVSPISGTGTVWLSEISIYEMGD